MAGVASLPGVRSLAVLLSTTIAVVLFFGLLLIQARSDLVLRRQQADFGEVARMASLFRDLGDMVTRRASQDGQRDGSNLDSSSDRFQVRYAAQDRCRAMPTAPTKLRLTLDGFQARDRKPVMSAFATEDGEPFCAQSSAQSVIQAPVIPGRSEQTRARELAITGPDGEVLLVLRGDWPQRIEPPAAKDKAALEGGAVPASDTSGKTPKIEIGGRERLVYQWPLDLGRPVTIQREEGPYVCAPRRCLLSALGDPPSAGAVLNNLSPFTKAAFGFSVVVLLLLIPLIKLASIDHNASLGWMDVVGIIAAVPLMVATLVTACAVIAFWGDLRRDNDTMAQGLAAAIAQDVDREVGFSLGAIERDTRAVWGDGWASSQQSGAGGASSPWQTYPAPLPLAALQLRSMVGSTIIDQLPTKDRPLADIRERRYFGRLRAGEVIPCTGRQGEAHADGGFGCGKGQVYTIDQVPAAANGDARMVVLLTRAGAANLVMSGKPPAATLAVPVPEGFGYAVIDPASLEVLQHSDPARAHNETFGSQLDAVDTLSRIAGSVDERCGLADAAQHRRAAEPTAGTPFDARYGGKRVRMSIGVACSAHWLVATWYDRSKLQRAALDPAFVAGVTMLCVGLVLAAGLGVMASTDPRSLLRKLWPDPEPFHSAEADQWYLRGMSAQLAVVVLMAAGLLLARGDAAFLHAALGLFLLLILLARKDADHSWGTLPVGWGKVATVFYAALGIYASVVLACCLGANWRAFAYPVLLVAMWIVAALDWFSLRKIDVRLPAWMERMRAAPAGFVPPSVMRRVNRVLRHQLVTIYLLAVIPALAACCAGAGQLRADRSLSDAWVLQQSRMQIADDIAQMRPFYDSAPKAKTPAPADLSARKLVADHAAAEPGAPSQMASAIMQLWTDDPVRFDHPLDLRLGVLADYARWAQARTGISLVTMPRSPGLVVLRDWLLAVGAMGVATFLTWRLLVLAAQNLFGLQHFGFRALHPRHTPEQIRTKSTRPIKAVFINYPTREFRKLQNSLDTRDRLEMFDLALERGKLGEKSMALLTAKSWIVTGFESIVANRDLRVKTLALLEQLTARPEVNVYFFVQTMPLVRLRQARDREKREAEVAGSAGIMNESESYRWAELFSEFITYTWTETLAEPAPLDPEPDPPRGGANLERLLELIDDPVNRASVRRWAARNPAVAEAIASEMIQVPSDRIQDQIRSFGISIDDMTAPAPPGELGVLNDLNDVYREQIHEYMANFLGDYYQGEWVRSSKEEHLTLHHLAHGKFINTSNFPVLNSLLTRRLVKTDPNFRLMNESFGHWIRTLEQPEWFHQFRQDAQRGGAWNVLRVPLLLLVAAGSVLITFLDHEGSGSLLTLLPGVVATMPMLLSRFTRPLQANA
ncbi:hypothetical protein QUC32_13340 [Novosphingobium resinovorum]|uniref:hypothetical protein n=1 Tax=Novosphingobium TaxID=165696 RepID=UPI001B3C7E2B|nr:MULTISPECIES: hypothetical protein [Novosphingobium]MBF7010656.1 hypothetical protein [Novosphingobium sp. HR1a]WJM28657.1 hypothetical protein QUC32_13340 [Novosphingobium resinovorum]